MKALWRRFSLGLVLVAAMSASAQQPAGASQPQPREVPGGPTPEVAQPAAPQDLLQAQQAALPIRVMVGKSVLINTAERLKRVSVTDPAIADAVVVSPTQVMIHGRAPGEVSLILWDETDRSRSFDLRVDVDVTSADQEIKRIFPDQKIDVSASRNALVISGHVEKKEDADRAALVAGAFAKNVVNVLTFGAVGTQEVLLEVKFAEVDRTAVVQAGINLFSTGATNTFGATGTQMFAPFTGAKVGAVPSDVQLNGQVPGSTAAAGAIGNTLNHQPGVFGTNDLLNIFLFRSDINLGAIIKALQQKNVLQILAEPNLIAVNGKEASFLAGGEFPYPVIQGAGALGSVTIQFKEFGVRLKFLPLIQPNGNIYLQVAPEVSALDFANGLTISGFVVPALSTRRAQTEFEIQDGQSFVIAGLLDNRLTNLASKLPGLGDIPIIGNLFKSKNLQKNNTELMVLVTAHRISPTTQPPALPKMPKEFLKPDAFDGKPAGAK
jgi:pilus assembly protein CpaC